MADNPETKERLHKNRYRKAGQKVRHYSVNEKQCWEREDDRDLARILWK